MNRLLPSLWSRFALLVAVLAMATASTSALAQQPKELQITQLRLGFNGSYKLGCWTQAQVSLVGGDDAFTGLVEITVHDSEGVPNSVVTPLDRAVAIAPGQPATARLFVRPGQDGSALQVRVVDDRGRERAKRSFYPGPEPGGDVVRYGYPATNRMVVNFGTSRGLGELARGQTSDDDVTAVRTVNVDAGADLPLEWYGYEAIDTLVLGSAQPELYRALGASDQRLAALNRWVELGGRVVIFCGVNAPELIGPDGPLAPLVPGEFDTLVPLRESQPIEAFANAEASLTQGRAFQVQVPRLTNVSGQILAFAGSNEIDLPLVIRARRGLGELTFVGLDPDAPPLADWPGRANLLKLALQWPAEEQEPGGQHEDLSDRLRRALDGSFLGIRPAPFALVALLVILYILLIGPGDYFFVKRVLKRMELTWLTFPLIVVAVSAGSYWVAHYMKGDKLRVNQVEIVDVDMSSGMARGTVWTHFFSPRVDRYNLTLSPRFGGNEVASAGASSGAGGTERLIAWLGSTGYGLDGMQGRGQAALFNRGYAFSPLLDAVIGLPVQEWSTRTLLSRWSAELIEPIDAELQTLDDELLSGHITNRTGVAMTDCLLLHANWAYRLPDLPDGAVATIDETLQPTSVETALTAVDAGSDAGGAAAQAESARLDVQTTDVNRLAMIMMFHEAAGGTDYSQAMNRYQAFTDLSRLIQGDQAILVARVPEPAGSQLTDGETALASDQDQHWVYYRFVIPLKEAQ